MLQIANPTTKSQSSILVRQRPALREKQGVSLRGIGPAQPQPRWLNSHFDYTMNLHNNMGVRRIGGTDDVEQ
jgi:hypothetical protein